MDHDSEESAEGAPPFSVVRRIESVRHASSGLARVIRSEHNAWLHGVATLLVIICGWGFGIDRGEWLAVVLAVAIVWTAESFNTAIETLCDVVSPERDPRIKKAKDISAGAVLVSAIGAFVIGVLIFVPRLLSLIGS